VLEVDCPGLLWMCELMSGPLLVLPAMVGVSKVARVSCTVYLSDKLLVVPSHGSNCQDIARSPRWQHWDGRNGSAAGWTAVLFGIHMAQASGIVV